jgi:DNA-nicking Smr family endonuclease
MKPPRGLSEEEAAAWARLAATVKPMRALPARKAIAPVVVEPTKAITKAPKGRVPPPRPQPAAAPAPPGPGLDSAWERKLTRGTMAPDFTLDLHGHTLASAHTRLDHGLAQAKALGARVVLVITGKPRPSEAADRGERRGAIRAKVLDWLAAGPHASSIAAIRKAHRRHGGDGALYLVLRKAR